jgi:threonine-phosphate decarboxylase
MLNHKDHFHGSDLEKIEELYQIKKEDITSFSANINPLGISDALRQSLAEHIDAIQTYPDREYKELRGAIASYCGASADQIIVGSGSTELISLLIATLAPKKALILGPTYSEYEREISLGGGHTLYYPLKETADFRMDVDDFCSQLDDSLDLIVLCNPNNPTSTAVNENEMRRILDACLAYGIFVMVDETYVEFTEAKDRISSVPLTGYYTNLAVLRGTSKFFAAPGLRLGYAVTGNRDLHRHVSEKQDPWTISSIAEIAGRIMFRDDPYIHRTHALIADERDRMFRELSAWDSVKVYRPMANFMLVKILKEDVDADQLFDHCIRSGLMIRNCSTFPFLSNRFFRFCFMLPEDNDRLIGKLRELL